MAPGSNLTDIHMAEIIKKDAFERYALIQHFMKETSEDWQLSIGAVMFVCVVLVPLLLLIWGIFIDVHYGAADTATDAIYGVSCLDLFLCFPGFLFPGKPSV